MRAVAYIRVSTDEQNLAAQRDALRKFEIIEDVTFVERFEDHGVSARTPFSDRPAGRAAFTMLAKRQADVIVTAAVDRMFRNVVEGLQFIDWANARKVRLISVREYLDTRTAAGRLALTGLLSQGEYERNIISERTRAAMQQMIRDGKCTGTPSFGTLRCTEDAVPDPKGKHLARDPATWSIRQQVVDLYRNGLPNGERVGYEKLSRYLRFELALRAPNGGAWWSKATLKSLHDTHDRLSELPLAAEVATPTTA